jgi:hypothetical protein
LWREEARKLFKPPQKNSSIILIKGFIFKNSIIRKGSEARMIIIFLRTLEYPKNCGIDSFPVVLHGFVAVIGVLLRGFEVKISFYLQ